MRPLAGDGMGLTLAKQLVEMHGGSIAAHSEGAGKGAEFTVRLPFVPPASRNRAKDKRKNPVIMGGMLYRVFTGRAATASSTIEIDARYGEERIWRGSV